MTPFFSACDEKKKAAAKYFGTFLGFGSLFKRSFNVDHQYTILGNHDDVVILAGVAPLMCLSLRLQVVDCV